MRPINQEQHDHARNLFFQSGKTRAQIAEAVGVSEKTIYLWTKAGDWKRLRSSSKLMPSLIVENFYSQIQELNEDIRNREPGKRYPSIQEAEIFRKLTVTAERIKKGHTQGEYAEMIQKFMEWLSSKSGEHVKLFTEYADRFLKTRSPEGFYPYDIEYTNLEPPLPKEEPEIPLFAGDVPETKEEITTQEHEITRNNSEPPYEATANASSENDAPKQEITNELGKEEITQEAPPLFLEEVPEGGRGQLAKNNSVEIGYLGIKQKPQPGDGVMLEIQKDDPDIQRFSIGEAIYYIRKKR